MPVSFQPRTKHGGAFFKSKQVARRVIVGACRRSDGWQVDGATVKLLTQTRRQQPRQQFRDTGGEGHVDVRLRVFDECDAEILGFHSYVRRS